ncbi:hypothetical protein AB0C59_29475 [Streptomyces sp. NPDC048664]|uniref:hypothetical protein n=1 Tax=Streptomyces sp. NPDC048664 TaxID=3154505 RepID=UPI00343DC38B
MHMNSVPQHLPSEDRQDYERILDEALRSAPHRPDLTAVGHRLNPEQLRTMALNATALIASAAATEYAHYVRVRGELRRPAHDTRTVGDPAAADAVEPEMDPLGLAATVGEATSSAGPGAVAAVLAPFLAGAAAAIFLLVGYTLRAVDPDQAFARTLLTTGWIFGAVTAATILIAAAGLLITALRNGTPAEATSAREALVAETALAREAWHKALLERGILPFLREALAEPGTTAMSRTPPGTTPHRMPNLGYGRPGFTSPESGSGTSTRPSYTSPDFTSPDFGGPDHRPE